SGLLLSSRMTACAGSFPFAASTTLKRWIGFPDFGSRASSQCTVRGSLSLWVLAASAAACSARDSFGMTTPLFEISWENAVPGFGLTPNLGFKPAKDPVCWLAYGALQDR